MIQIAAAGVLLLLLFSGTAAAETSDPSLLETLWEFITFEIDISGLFDALGVGSSE